MQIQLTSIVIHAIKELYIVQIYTTQGKTKIQFHIYKPLKCKFEKGKRTSIYTCESSIVPVGATKKAPSSKGGEGSPPSSSSSFSTTDGFLESGVPSSEATNIQ